MAHRPAHHPAAADDEDVHDVLHAHGIKPVIRRFPAIPRARKEFERLYRGRTVVERVNARLKIFWGADDGNVTGARRFDAMVGTVMVVHLVFATLLAKAPRWQGTLSQTRIGPVAKALQETQAA